jgi:hypothetical protein
MVDWLSTPGSGEVGRDEFERLKGCVLHLVLQRYRRPTRRMRYFTRDWVDEHDAVSAYRERLAEIAGKLPPQSLELAKDVSLHDGVFRRFDVDESSGGIEISLEIQDDRAGRPRVDLRYDNAAVIGGYTDEMVRMINDPDTVVLAHEVDVVGESVFEHRMLLWPEGELAISFSGFSFSKTPTMSTASEIAGG